jgi:hypothetical protein
MSKARILVLIGVFLSLAKKERGGGGGDNYLYCEGLEWRV